MAEFDPTKYFSLRSNNAEVVDGSRDLLLTKMNEVHQATQEKQIKALGQYTNALEAAQENSRIGNQDSWVNKLGLDLDSFAGGATNLTASGVDGAVRIEKNIGAGLHDLKTAAIDQKIPDQAKAAYAKVLDGTATEADHALLDLPSGWLEMPTYMNPMTRQAFKTGNLETNRQRIARMQESIDSAGAVRELMDSSSIVHRGNQEKLQNDLGTGFNANVGDVKKGWDSLKEGQLLGTGDLVSGIAGMLASIGSAAVDNPAGAAEFVTNNIPQLVLAAGGPAGMALTNLPYAINDFGEGIAAYQKAHDGAMPPEAEIQRMAAYAASLAIAETVGDKLVLGAKGLVGKGAAEGAEQVARTGLKKALSSAADSVTARTIAAVGTGATGEFFTEAWQTFAENEIRNKESTPKEVFVGGAIGAISGGALSGGVHLSKELSAAGAQVIEKAKKRAVDQEATKAAVAAGDPGAFLDPDVPAYDPSLAVATLLVNNQKPDTTPEQRQANLNQAGTVVADLESQYSELREQYEAYSPETLKQLQDKIKVQQRKLDALDPTDTERATQLQEQLTGLREWEAQFPSKAEQTTATKRQIDQLEIQLTEARKLKTGMEGQLPGVEQGDLDAAITQATTAEDAPSRQEAAARVVILSMAAPERVSPEVAEQLAADEGNGLSTAQRSYLRQMGKARTLINEMKGTEGVFQDILFGREGQTTKGERIPRMLGIQDYIHEIGTAVASGNQKHADAYLGLLRKFTSDHTNKVSVLQDGLKRFHGGEVSQVVKNTLTNSWEIDTALIPYKQVRSNGGYTFRADRSHDKFVGQIGTEARALQETLKGMEEAYALAFGTNPVSSDIQSTVATTVDSVAQVPSRHSIESSTVEGQNQSNVDNTVDAQDAPTEKVVGNPSTSGVDSSTPTEKNVSAKNAEGKTRLEEDKSSNQTSPVSSSQKESNTESVAATSPTAQATAAPSGATAPVATQEENQPTPIEAQDAAIAPAVAAPVTEEGEVVETAEGILDVISQEPAPKGTLLTQIAEQGKLFATYFTQSLKRDGDTSSRPLVAVKDFFTKAQSKAVGLASYLPQSADEVTAEERHLLQYFGSQVSGWMVALQKGLKVWDTSNKQFLYKDPVQELLIQNENGKPDLPENVKTAMVYAGFTWLQESTARPEINTEESVNRLLARRPEDAVTQAEMRAFKTIAVRENTAINTVGARVLQALGMQPSPDAPLDFVANTEAAVGTHVITMLQTLGLIDVVSFTGTELKQLGNRQVEEDTDTSVRGNEVHRFIEIARDSTDRTQFKEAIQELVSASKGAQNILDDLFRTEPGMTGPTLAPVPFSQTTTSRGQEVPKAQREILEKHNNQAHELAQDLWNTYDELDEDIQVQMAGGEFFDKNKHQISRRDSMDARVSAFQREITHIKDFVQYTLGRAKEGFDNPVYFAHEVWDQFRVGITSNTVNPQMSKIARALFRNKAWTTQVGISNDKQMANFKLRVLEGLGIKTGNEANATSLLRLQGLFDQDASTEGLSQNDLQKQNILNAAVDVLVKRLDGDPITRTEQETLLRGVQTGKEGMHSFSALQALAELRRAQRDSQANFTTGLTGEIDGVTNGPILAHLLYGAAYSAAELSAFLKKGGLYSQGDTETDYNLWRAEPGSLDLYETMTAAAVNVLQAQMQDSKRGFVYAAVQHFIGELIADGSVTSAGRNLSKDPIRPLVFGSAQKRAIDSMGEAFVAGLAKQIEALPEGNKQADREVRVDAIKALNILLNKTGVIPLGMSKADLLDLEFTTEQQKAIQQSFTSTFGEAYKQAIKDVLTPFLERRGQITQTSELIYRLYDAAYQAERDAYIQELIEAGKIDFFTSKEGEKKPRHDLSARQEKVLRKRLTKLHPTVHTVTSLREGNLEAGLPVYKIEYGSTENPLYRPEVHLSSEVSESKARYPNSRERVVASPGVGLVSMFIHSFDSADSYEANPEGVRRNLHDAQETGLNDFTEMGHAMNQALWDNALDYSPLTELSTSLERTLQNLREMLKRKDVPPGLKQYLAQTLAEFAVKHKIENPLIVLDQVMGDMHHTAYTARGMTLGVLSDLASMDQYASEGAKYEVSEDDRTKAKEKLEEHDKTKELSEDTLTAVQAITNHTRSLVERIHGELIHGKETAQKRDTPAQPKTAKDLVTFLKSQGKFAAKDVLPILVNELRNDRKNPNNAFRYSLIQALNKALSPDLTVHWISDKSQASVAPEGNDLGWYVPSTEDIYLLGSEFLGSDQTTTEQVIETLLHELTHGALAKVIEREMQNATDKTDLNTHAHKAYQDLESLLEAASKFVKDNDLSGFDAALGSVQELVAYGMTNAAFQTQVLKQLTFESKTLRNKLTDGLKGFVRSLVGLIFPNQEKTRQELMENGMVALINNVAHLLEQTNTDVVVDPGRTYSQASRIAGYTSQEILRALNPGGLNPAFSDHLQSLLDRVVKNLHGPFGVFKATIQASTSLSALDLFAKIQVTGQMPFVSSIPGSTFQVSEQEAFVIEQIEATVRHALNDDTLQTTTAHRELVKLYQEAESTMTVQDFHDGDWSTANQDEQDLAQQRYDFVFKMEKGKDGRTDHLSRFAAMGLAHAGFNHKLDWATKTKATPNSDSLTARIQFWFENLLAWFSRRLTHTYAGQQANHKLESLVTVLVDIEARKQRALLKKQAREGRFDLMASTEAGAQKVMDAVRQGVVAAAKSNLAQNKLGSPVKLAGGVVRIVAGQHVDKVISDVVHLFEEHTTGHDKLVNSLLNELKGPREKFEALQRQATFHQKERQTRIGNVAQIVLASFEGELSDKEKAGVSMLLRTGAHVLLDHFSLAQIEVLASDEKALNKAIQDWQTKLTGFGKVGEFYTYYAKVLAGNMVLGGNTDPNAYFNAKGIARMSDTQWENGISEQQANQAEPIIDVLTTLYAIKYAPQNTTTALQRVLRREGAREDKGNGIEMVLKLHRKMEGESRERLFKDNELLMMKGYLPEIYNPYIDVKSANLKEGEALTDLGYVRSAEVGLDPADPTQETRHLYVMRDGGAERWVTGVVLNKGEGTKGTRLHNGLLNNTTAEGQASSTHQSQWNSQRVRHLARMQRPDPNFDPTYAVRHIMAPVRNAQGKVVNARYLMKTTTRDTVLERDNRFEHLLGALTGSIYDKQATPQHNEAVFEALYEVYKKDFSENGKKFVLIGPNSTDPALREIYALLPDSARKQIKALWKNGVMAVPKDLVYPVFGYRKETLSKVYDKEFSDRTVAEQVLTWTVDHMLYHYARMRLNKSADDATKYARRGAYALRKSEHMWQAAVDVVKDTIVIRTGVVFGGNVASNVTLLKLAGVPWAFMAQKHVEAMRGATDYMRDRRELMRLQTLLESGYTQKDEARIKREIVQVENALTRNPVRTLIEGGLMPTIVEDLNDTDDIYSYKALFDRKVEGWSKKVNPRLLQGARNVLMTKDTALYKGLRHATQLSDFVARYTLVEHLTKNEGMDLEQALFEASESFVNYDTPMHPTLQYTDDMGFTMFTKYFLRIQRVLMRHAKDHPLRVLTLALLDNYVDIAAVTDSTMFTRIGNNPLEWGAFQLPGVVDDVATISAGMALVR